MTQEIYKSEEYTIFRYPLSLRDYYVKGIDNMYFKKKVRFFLNYLSGGGIYCLKYNKTDEKIGYCMISVGKAFHYNYASERDITIGPIYLKGDFRGKRLSILLLENVLNDNKDKEKAFAYIHRINKQSNALFSRVGFIPNHNVDIAKISRRVSFSDKENTDYRLYVLDMKKYKTEIIN